MKQELNSIIHIDDEEDIRTITNLVLVNTGGFTVASFDRGQKGIDAVITDKPDLIICDVMMPEMDGPETLKKLRAQGNETPFFFMTAKVQHHQVDELISFGAQGVIKKPYDPMKLSEDIRGMWMNL
jgi:CheY-like chemotaxis protein